MNDLHAPSLAREGEREALPCLYCGHVSDDCAEPPRRATARRWLAGIAVLCLLLMLGFASARATELPGDSVYQLDASLVDQDGHALAFADGRGQPRLVSLFYSSCQYVCPMIIDTLRKTERALPPAQRAHLGVLLVSIDPDTDTPTALKRLAEQRHIETPRWRLARTDAATVRRLAAVLGIQYKQLGKADFSHSSALILLDAQGRIVARSEKLGEPEADFIAAVKQILASP